MNERFPRGAKSSQGQGRGRETGSWETEDERRERATFEGSRNEESRRYVGGRAGRAAREYGELREDDEPGFGSSSGAREFEEPSAHGGAYRAGYDAASWESEPSFERGGFGRAGGAFGRGAGAEVRETRPRFRGLGPKGYKRSDERIREDVCDRLTEADVDVSQVEVRVDDGDVILVGEVSDRDDKHEIERLCESVSGVRDVQNQIRLSRDGTEKPPAAARTAGVAAGTPAGRSPAAAGQPPEPKRTAM